MGANTSISRAFLAVVPLPPSQWGDHVPRDAVLHRSPDFALLQGLSWQISQTKVAKYRDCHVSGWTDGPIL